MKSWRIIVVTVLCATALAGCEDLNHLFCAPNCHAQTRASSSLVDFLYPQGQTPPPENAVPELRLPLRVGLAFLPSTGSNPLGTLDAAHREELLERIRERFKSRRFVAEIVTIPDYYLAGKRGFEGLESVQRLYHTDLMALVSYDQVTHADDSSWSLAYLTIVGAYVVRGTRQDVSTLVDLAVVDPVTRSLVLRAGGTSAAHDTSTAISADRDARNASNAGFSMATDQMVEHFDVALTEFEQQVKNGTARVKVVHSGGGAGAFSIGWLLLGWVAVAMRRRSASSAGARNASLPGTCNNHCVELVPRR
jgi:rhombotail lipoprotein